MKTTTNHNQLDRLSTSVNYSLEDRSFSLLRIGMGIVFFSFGLLKYFLASSPIEVMSTQSVQISTWGLLTDYGTMDLVAGLDCLIGICFITGEFFGMEILLMGFQVIGALLPLLIRPGELFVGPFHAPTLTAQFMITEGILKVAGLAFVSLWTGAELVAKSKSLPDTLPPRTMWNEDPLLKPSPLPLTHLARQNPQVVSGRRDRKAVSNHTSYMNTSQKQSAKV